MKYYNFARAKRLIKENKSNLESASLGMHEDWFWTAQPIWENGQYQMSLPSNVSALKQNEEYKAKRKAGIGLFDKEMEKYSSHLIAGLFGSDWATPTLQMRFKDGTEKFIECSMGESTAEKPAFFSYGVLSGPVQKSLPPITDKN